MKIVNHQANQHLYVEIAIGFGLMISASFNVSVKCHSFADSRSKCSKKWGKKQATTHLRQLN